MSKILIIQTAFIGDVILATSVIESIADHSEDYLIDILVRKGNESLLENNPHLNSVLSWDKKRGKYSNLFRLVRKIRSNKYDAVINLQRFGASGFLTAFSGSRFRIGFNKNPFSFRFTHAVKHHMGGKSDSAYPHEIDRNFELLKPVGIQKLRHPKLYPSNEDEEASSPYISSPYVTVSPTSVWYTKQWPMEKWVDLIKGMQEFQIILLGAKNDVKFCRELAQKSGHSRIMVKAGETSFLQSAALMKDAAMNFVNDSAPLHIASAVNASVVAVYCSTIPQFGFGPLSERSMITETNENMDCRPCGIHGKKQCPLGHFNCAHSIETAPLIKFLKEA